MFENIERPRDSRPGIRSEVRNEAIGVERKLRIAEFHKRTANRRIVSGPVELDAAVAKCNEVVLGDDATCLLKPKDLLLRESRGFVYDDAIAPLARVKWLSTDRVICDQTVAVILAHWPEPFRPVGREHRSMLRQNCVSGKAASTRFGAVKRRSLETVRGHSAVPPS
jgi:hypothetical protein